MALGKQGDRGGKMFISWDEIPKSPLYFRMHMVGYFEGIDSERDIEWRCADSLSLREFLLLDTGQGVPDHSSLS